MEILHIIEDLKKLQDDHSNVIQQTRIKYPLQSLGDLAKKGAVIHFDLLSRISEFTEKLEEKFAKLEKNMEENQ